MASTESTTVYPEHPIFWKIKIPPEDAENFNITPVSSIEKLCTMCDEPSKLHCTGCSQVKYCPKICQQSDWPFHKLLCKASRRFSGPTRPPGGYNIFGGSASFFRAILFPHDKQKPEWVWVGSNGPVVSLKPLWYRSLAEVCGKQQPAHVENLAHKVLRLRAPGHGYA